jgi:hypothetical protein
VVCFLGGSGGEVSMIHSKSVDSVIGVGMEFNCVPDELVHIARF